MITKELLVSELQELRESIGNLHNHKEQSAYAVFAFIVGGAGWAATSRTENALLFWLLFFGACALHFMMRFQLRQRLHCAQFYRVYFASVRRVLQMSDLEVRRMKVIEACPELEAETQRFSTLFWASVLWSRKETLPAAARNYPAFSVVHEEILSTSERFVRAGVPVIEQVPTCGSLACIVFILGYAVDATPFAEAWAAIARHFAVC